MVKKLKLKNWLTPQKYIIFLNYASVMQKKWLAEYRKPFFDIFRIVKRQGSFYIGIVGGH